MDGDKFFSVVEEIFELEPGEVNGATALEQVPGWDSLTLMGLIARVDEEFGVTLSPAKLSNCENLSELRELIAKISSEKKAA